MTKYEIRRALFSVDAGLWLIIFTIAFVLLTGCSGGSSSPSAKALTGGSTTGTTSPPPPAVTTLPDGFYVSVGKFDAIVGKLAVQDILGAQIWVSSAGFEAELIGSDLVAPGMYAGKLDSSPAVLTVDAGGSVFGSSSAGCTISGVIAADQMRTFAGSDNCVGGPVTGFAGLVDDQLMIVAVSSSPLGGELLFNGAALPASPPIDPPPTIIPPPVIVPPVIVPPPSTITPPSSTTPAGCPPGDTLLPDGRCQAPAVTPPVVPPVTPPVVVPPVIAPPVITPPTFGLTFTASGADPQTGAYTLFWSSTSDGCNIAEIYGSFPPNGQTDVEPIKINFAYPVTYHIDCHQGGADALASVVIMVQP